MMYCVAAVLPSLCPFSSFIEPVYSQPLSGRYTPVGLGPGSRQANTAIRNNDGKDVLTLATECARPPAVAGWLLIGKRPQQMDRELRLQCG
jgi:hypothetical protein